jgi:hypothetical protein
MSAAQIKNHCTAFTFNLSKVVPPERAQKHSGDEECVAYADACNARNRPSPTPTKEMAQTTKAKSAAFEGRLVQHKITIAFNQIGFDLGIGFVFAYEFTYLPTQALANSAWDEAKSTVLAQPSNATRQWLPAIRAIRN